MVSTFLVFAASLSFLWGALLLYNTSASGVELSGTDWLIALLSWCISAMCLGSAAVLDGIKTAAREMSKKLEELAGSSD